jgi:sarcosine oxidase
MDRNWDVIIVGGGVIGSAVAYFLKAWERFAGSVLVIEKDPTYANSSTARSAGGLRQQFSTRENIEIGLFGAAFVKRAGEYLAVDGERPDLSFREQGYLFLATESGRATLAANVALQRALGADIELMDAPGLARRFPWLSTGDLAAGAFGRANEGWLDPYALLQAFRRKARAAGAVFLHDECVGLAREGRRIAAVEARGRGRLGCGTVVNAAGPAAGRVAALAGVPLPVEPRKRMVFVFDCRDGPHDAPLTIDPSGTYFRPEGAHFICGRSPDEALDRECWDLEPDHGAFESEIWPTIAQRAPVFEALKPLNAWAGHYDYNTLDQNAILGPHPEIGNFLFANGFSGHGLQQSPAVGRAIAELVVHGRYVSLDLARFGYARVAAGAPIFENNVV